jgi:hypothetical protein
MNEFLYEWGQVLVIAFVCTITIIPAFIMIYMFETAESKKRKKKKKR